MFSLLLVSVPPGPPLITGYQQGLAVRQGDMVTLDCASRGGNPLAEVKLHKHLFAIASKSFSFTIARFILPGNGNAKGILVMLYSVRALSQIVTKENLLGTKHS